ncbi:acyltransferase family protein [Duffyella gerundensis]|uniref:acyltransferase family protein n=1 Tax=Duffyella TaxID=3026546 RepID=UPI003F6DF91E
MENKNNFDIVRLVLALIVLLVHAAEVTRSTDIAWLAKILDSDFAVKGFFSISGYLICKSYIRSSSLGSYFKKRFARILPAYIFAIFFCMIIGVCLTTLPLMNFILNKTTLKYVVANLSFLNFVQPTLPGVFTDNPNQPMDGSLWTIKAELMLYLLLPAIVPFIKKYPLKTYLAIFAVSVVWFFYFTSIYSGPKAETLAKQFIYLSSYFFFGSLLATNISFFSKLKEISIASLVLYVLMKNTHLSFLIEPIVYSAMVILFCTNMFKEVKISHYGDLSYGLYLYHWPVIQVITHFGLYDSSPYMALLLTIIITLTMALISWHLLEKRFLQRKRTYSVDATDTTNAMLK